MMRYDSSQPCDITEDRTTGVGGLPWETCLQTQTYMRWSKRQ